MADSITDVPGIVVGHTTDLLGGTGCTVLLTPDGAAAGVAVRGAAPGSRELSLLEPGRLVQRVHGIVLTGGSAFGLAAADGVMRWLEERGYGMNVGVARVPIVPAAVLFDLGLGNPRARPTAEDGYAACVSAGSGPVPAGNVGAGAGATVGKTLGARQAMKGGLGSASGRLYGEVNVGVLVVVNALGDVHDPESGRLLAGARDPETGGFAGALEVLRSGRGTAPIAATNTTLGIVATDAALDKADLGIVAGMAHAGLARSIRPIHALVDGDVVFAVSNGSRTADVTAVGALAAQLMAAAVVRAVMAAEPLFGVPSASSPSATG